MREYSKIYGNNALGQALAGPLENHVICQSFWSLLHDISEFAFVITQDLRARRTRVHVVCRPLVTTSDSLLGKLRAPSTITLLSAYIGIIGGEKVVTNSRNGT